VFYYDRGLFLTAAQLAVDVTRVQPRAFISHAHSDHMARHRLALCTEPTARLYRHRLGPRDVRVMAYRESISWGGLKLTCYPAGHCLGSAMLLADDGAERLLYTGDFKLSRSATSQTAELPKADLLVMESTYGAPEYRFPPRDEIVERFVAQVREALADGRTPVVMAYALGKAQEVTAILTSAGIPVLQSKAAFEISRIYEQCGVSLGNYGLLGDEPTEGRAIVVPPGRSWPSCVRSMPRPTTFAVTGWALNARGRNRARVDVAVPLSDHADYDELFEAVERVAPREIYCTHGPESFVDELRNAGFNATRLEHMARAARRI